MTDFDHGGWARAKAELALNPLPACGREVVDRLLMDEVIYVDASKSDELSALRGLFIAGVIYHHFGTPSYSASPQLRAAHERGLISELFA